MKQRIISLIMALVMTLTLLPTPTWATTNAEPQIASDQAQAQDQSQEAQEEQTPVQTTSSQDEPVKEETETPEIVGEIEEAPVFFASTTGTTFLKSLTLAAGVDKANAPIYGILGQGGRPISRGGTYSISIRDNYSNLFANAEVADGYTVVVNDVVVKLNGESNNTKIFTKQAGPETWKVSVQVKDAKEGTVAESYTVNLKKRTTLEGLKLSVDGTEEPLDFQFTKTQYSLTIPGDAQTAQLEITLPFADYGAWVNGELVSDPSNVTVALAGIDKITIKAQSDVAEGTPYEYVITLHKTGVIPTTISAAPEGALVALYDSRNDRVWPSEDGSFSLMEGQPYTYVVTCKGYVGQTGTFTAGTDESINVTLTEAKGSTHGSGTMPYWPSFRGNEENNGVVSAKTPIWKGDTTLLWAEKLGAAESGESQTTGQLGCPILITENGKDYLIVYSGKELYKVNAANGKTVKTGTMVESSNFAITPPTYAEGMIFVGLKDGRVQAFDAETLESLWVYQDPLGGQPNCPITYHNGYVYTGFWQSDTGKANFACISVQDEDSDSRTETKLARWTHAAAGGYYWAGAYVCNDYVLVGTDDGMLAATIGEGKLLCLDPDTGKLLAQATVRGDARSTIAKGDDGAFYFTTKGGYFYKATVTKSEAGYTLNCTGLELTYDGRTTGAAMSTSTPVIYNKRAYIGVCGAEQFTQYSGHNITVIDLSGEVPAIAYSVKTMGYPQTSGLLTTAYDQGDGTVYVYFIDNYTPGPMRLLKDKPGQIQAELVEDETYNKGGWDNEEVTEKMAYTLFTPWGDMSAYAICSPIVDRNGTMYFKNDSGFLMALGTQPKGDINHDGVTDVYDLQRLYEHCRGISTLSDEELQDAGLTGKPIIEMQNLYTFLTTGRWASNAAA